MSLFISRRTYDQLIDRHPSWMRDEFPKHDRKWSLAGVLVSFAPDVLHSMVRDIEVEREDGSKPSVAVELMADVHSKRQPVSRARAAQLLRFARSRGNEILRCADGWFARDVQLKVYTR